MTILGSGYRTRRAMYLTALAGLASLACLALGDDHGAATHGAPPSDSHAAAPTAKPAASKPVEGAMSKAPAKAPGTTAKQSKPVEKPAANPNAESKADDTKPVAEGEGAIGGRTNTKSNAPSESSSASQVIEQTESLTADQAMKLLTEGNARWVASSVNTPNTSIERRKAVAEGGQHPFVTVLTCADSRLPVERLFDRGVGDVFVVRVAGNIAGTSETGTIEYGIEHLKTPLLVIMGHSKCGAVNAAATHAEVGGAIAKIVDQIEPAVERAAKNNPGVEGANLVPMAVKENVWQSVFDLLKGSHETRELVESGKLRIVGAVCDITTGKVEWMGEHPWQKELISAFNADDRTQGAAHADAGATNDAAKASHEAAETHH